jgi:thiamine biosynthesis protein ThiI
VPENLKIVLSRIGEDIVVNDQWDCLEVDRGDIDAMQKLLLLEALASTPGVDQFSEVDRFPLRTMAEILEIADRYYGPSLPGKTFAVRCKRMGEQSFKSIDVEQAVGAGLNLKCDNATVKLKDPEVTVALEVREQKLYVLKQTHSGLGGYPLGGQDAVPSLISGGFDSAVSSYMTVPFLGVVEEILTSVEDSEMGVVLKRLMLRAANGVAQNLNVHALVTGESVAQVASQTLTNLNIIDEVSELMVLRPLCMTDKQTIINKAREIGTEEFPKHIPEYCAVTSDSPTTKAKAQRLAEQESRFD